MQFGCAAIVLALFSYFLATLNSHGLHIDDWIRAVEGISGSAVLYTVLCFLVLCCAAGHPVTSLLTMGLDVCFAGAFIYVASANRGGASSCTRTVNTPFGTGDADSGRVDDGKGGSVSVPNLRQACQMQTACLAVSIVAIFFFLFSIITEYGLIRHRRKERRFGPGPANGYTEGYGKRRFFGFGPRRRTTNDMSSTLPEHPHPDAVRESYATERTRVGTATSTAGADANKFDTMNYAGHDVGTASTRPPVTGTRTETGTGGAVAGSGYGQNPWNEPVPMVQYPAGNYRYDDGVYDRT